jgi:hypothetical protein
MFISLQKSQLRESMFDDYPERTKYDKKARNYRYLYDVDFSKYHWNDLTLKERDYWRGLVQIDEECVNEKKLQEHHARDERARRQKNRGLHRRTHPPQQGG